MLEIENEKDEITYYLFVKKDYRYFDPQYLSTNMPTVKWIFPVPESNAVGALDEYNNGIMFIKFGNYGEDTENKIVVQNHDKRIDIRFYCQFSSNYTNDTIIYSQNHAVSIINVKTAEVFFAEIVSSVEDYISEICFLYPPNNLFVIVKSIDRDNDSGILDDYLHIAMLDGQQFVDTGWSMYLGETDDDDISPHFPLYHTWQVHDRKLFVYDQERRKIVCTDGKQSVAHPFLEVFNANAKLFYIVKDIAIHPNLPFGVIIEENIYGTHELVVLRWDIANPKKQDERVLSFGSILEELPPLFGLKRLTLVYQSFSPDGNWYVVGFVGGPVGNESRSPHFVAIPVTPVDKEHPYFIDIEHLVVLGQVAGLTPIA
jgi:hypothetical protein